MTGVDHRIPGLAVAALTDDDAYVELVADGHHVHPALWPIILRTKPADRLMLVSDAMSLAGTGDGHGVHRGPRGRGARRPGHPDGHRHPRRVGDCHQHRGPQPGPAGRPLPVAVAAASSNPAALLGVADRGRIAPGQRADLVELDDDCGSCGSRAAGSGAFRPA